MLSFEVYRKRGRNWQYLGTYRNATSRGAASAAAYAHNCKVLGVRPEDSRDKILVHRFVYVPLLSYAGH
jgi:hypothetical protein